MNPPALSKLRPKRNSLLEPSITSPLGLIDSSSLRSQFTFFENNTARKKSDKHLFRGRLGNPNLTASNKTASLDSGDSICDIDEKQEMVILEDYEDDDDDDAYDDDEESDSDGMDILDMMFMIMENDEDTIFANNGYKKLDKIQDTLQGQLYDAEICESTEKNIWAGGVGTHVVIKKVNKEFNDEHIAEAEDGTTVCITKDVLKEADILRFLTMDNKPIGDYIVKYIDFFESSDYYYLVTERVEGMNLKIFTQIARSYLEIGKMKLKDFQNSMRYIMWQMVTTLRFLHDIYHCCHLDLCLENIMLQNVEFRKNDQNDIIISNGISIKVCDFGVAEIFSTINKDDDLFKCHKQDTTVKHHQYQPPSSDFEESYDARASDMWALGMIFYECMTGRELYKPQDMWYEQENNGYWAVQRGKLKKFLKVNKELHLWTADGLDLLCKLLNIDEDKRITITLCIQHKYFGSYFDKYQAQIAHKMIKDVKRVSKQFKKMELPFYDLELD